jgi:hypothetical protein
VVETAAGAQLYSESNQAYSWPNWASEPPAPANKGEANQSGWLSLGTTFVKTTGNDQEFSRAHQMDDEFLYGLRDAGYTYKQDGFLAEVTGRAVEPWDFGAGVSVKQTGVGFVQGTFNEFPTYYDNTHGFYNFAPRVYEASKELATRREDSNVTGGWYVDRYTTVQVRTNYWENEGSHPPLAGGLVASSNTNQVYRYPDWTQVEEHRERIGTDIIRKIGRFELRLSFDATDFDGGTDTVEPHFDRFGHLVQTRDDHYTPEYNELRPRIQFSGDLIEKILRVEYEGEYDHVRNNSTSQQQAFDPNGVPSGLTSGTAALNNRDNTHVGTEDETIHNVRLVYTPNDRMKMYGGFGFKFIETDGDSAQNQFTPPDPTIDDIILARTSDMRRIWMSNIGGEYRILPWLVAAADGTWEHGYLARDWWNLDEGGTVVTDANLAYHWKTTEESDRITYGASLTAKPCREIKIVGRWLETREWNDYNPSIELDDGGVVNPDTFRALVGDNGYESDEWSILTQYKPSSYLEVTYKLSAKTQTNIVRENDPRPLTGGGDDLSNNLRVTVRPIDKLSVSVYGAIDDYNFLTAARSNPKLAIPTYGENFVTWGIEPSVELTRWCTLSGGFCQRWGTGGDVAENGDMVQDYRQLDAYLGAVFKINKMWSADARYTFTWYDENDNGSLLNYTDHTFTVGATAKF